MRLPLDHADDPAISYAAQWDDDDTLVSSILVADDNRDAAHT